MKKINTLIAMLLFFLGSISLPAQIAVKRPVPAYAYLSSGLIIPLGARLAGEVMIGPGWSFSVFYLNLSRSSPNTPADFKTHFNLFGSSVDHTISENLIGWGVTFGKAWRLSKATRLRFHLRTGLASGRFESPENFVRNSNGFFSNYNYDLVQHKTVSFILQPMLDIPFCRFSGLSVGLLLHVGKYWKTAGLEITHSLGYFSSRRPARK